MRSIFGLIKIFRFLRDNNVKWSKKLLLLAPIIYLFLPFDLIGDFFPLAGQLDDVAVFIVMWPILKKLLSDYESGNYTGKNINKKQYKDAVDIDKNDYEVK